MNKTRRVITPLGVTLACAMLICGAAAGLGLGRGWRAADFPTAAPPTQVGAVPPPVAEYATPTPVPTAVEHALPLVPTARPQVNVAILVVDSFHAPVPSLQAVWIAALHPELKTAYLLGLSPYAWVKLGDFGEMRLRDTYIFDPASGGGGPGFEAALAAVAYAPPTGTITIDTALLAEIVNLLGGVDLDGLRMDGAGAAAYALAATPNDPLGQSLHQVEFLGALRDSAVVSLYDIAPYVELIVSRSLYTVPPENLYSLALAFQGFRPADLGIAPPVPDPQLVVTAPDGQPAVLLPGDLPDFADTAAAVP